jgi:site-specific DNA-methyltransferase (adenine-specific)
MNKPTIKLICEIRQGDCLKVLPTLPKAKMIFADPPDNLGLKYDGFADKIPDEEYIRGMVRWVSMAMVAAPIVWFSIYHKWLAYLMHNIVLWEQQGCGDWKGKLFIWRFTFGQHRDTDCGNGFRPIIRLLNMADRNGFLYPDAIREESQRQRNGDKRANPAGRVPDDVWDFSRVCGTFKERRQWHPNQHPEALIERIIKFSTIEGDLVIDMFAGTGTVNRVCKRLNRNCIGIEQSRFYCDKITEELGLTSSV